MGRPAKTHKKKSFMFTTKHTSFLGVLGIVIAVCAIAIVTTLIIASYHSAGNVEAKFGTIGLIVMILNLIGVISGLISLNERDTYITPGIIAISANGVILLMWAFLIFVSV